MSIVKEIIIIVVLCIISQIGNSQSKEIFPGSVPIKAIDPLAKKWSFLKQTLHGKRIVALGESLHGVKEYNLYKYELVRFLHEEMGFNIIAIESDLAMNYFGDQYLDQITDSVFLEKAVTPVWHTEQHLKLVKYIRETPDLKIIGFDIIDPNTVNTALQTFQIAATKVNHRDSLIRSHYQLINPLYKNERHFYNGHRDSIMAKNLTWIIEQLYPEEKIIISAANDHISKVQRSKFGYMGALLTKRYKSEYYSIGLVHSLGSPTHLFRDVFYKNELSLLPEKSLQARLLKQKEDSLFIDIEKMKKYSEYSWLSTEIPHIIETNKHEHNINLSKSFDAIIWIKEVSHPNYIIESEYHWKYKDYLKW